MFRSFEVFNYRVWASGAIVSNVGIWMQRTAQDWIVLTQLTDNNAAALGVLIVLQFAPQVLLLPVTGFAADHLDRRKLLLATQGSMGLLSLGLGLLTLGGHAQLWQVYLFALLLGCVAAFDAPARMTFVSDLVGPDHLSNAVALNSTSYNLGRLIGPAVAGLLIAAVGSGWVFIVNAATFAVVLCSLALLRVHELQPAIRAPWARGSLADGFRYVRHRRDLMTIMLMMFVVGIFAMNFPIYLSTMSVSAFGLGAGAFGLLTSAMAVGSILGSLLAARRVRPGIRLLVVSAFVLAASFAVSAIMPTYTLFAVALIAVGASVQTLTVGANSVVQLSTDPAMRGRVIALLFAVSLAGTPIGAPIAGWVTNAFGPRWAIVLAAASGLVVAGIGLFYLTRLRNARLSGSPFPPAT